MTGRSTILIDHTPQGKVAALWQNGRLEDVLVDPPASDPTPRLGAIHMGQVGRPMKGINGCFVELGDGQTGFLRNPKGLRPGAHILVQVTGQTEVGKSPPVSQRLMFKGQLAIVTPGAAGLNVARSIRDEETRAILADVAREAMEGAAPDLGLILRTAAADANPEDVLAEVTDLRRLAEAVLSDTSTTACLLVDAPDAAEQALRDWPAAEVIDEAGAFERFDIWGEISRLTRDDVPLKAGGSLCIQPTRALVAIDVNTGADLTPAAALKTNLAAARDIPRQLRLRGLGGQIIVDFAPLTKRERRDIETALRAGFKADGIETSLVGWTQLGLFELQRKKERRPLMECIGDIL